MVVTIYNCPHCNQNHNNIRENRFNVPMPPGSNWMICPVTFKVIYGRGAGIFASLDGILIKNKNDELELLEKQMYKNVRNPFKSINHDEFEKNIKILWKLRKECRNYINKRSVTNES